MGSGGLEDLSAYTYQAGFAGVTQEKLGAAFVKFNKVASDAFNGVGKGGEIFEALGITITGTDGKLKTTSALFEEVADKMSQFEDGPQKYAAAMELFGKSAGPELVPMLNEGREGMRIRNTMRMAIRSFTSYSKCVRASVRSISQVCALKIHRSPAFKVMRSK